MKTGDKVTPRYTAGYCLTRGKEYIVTKFEPSVRDEHFTWPSYVFVLDDMEREVCCHAHRFDVVPNE